MAEDEEIAALVIDNGSGMCKGRSEETGNVFVAWIAGLIILLIIKAKMNTLGTREVLLASPFRYLFHGDTNTLSYSNGSVLFIYFSLI